MTTIYLIRHADNDGVPNGISGRSAGVHLNEHGRAQAAAVAERLSGSGIHHIYCSPLERTRETAEPIAAALDLPLHPLEAVQEVEFGEWTRRPLSELERDRRWHGFNHRRSVTRIPGGELMLETQTRMVTALEQLRADYPDDHVAVVSHGDPIRAALCYYAGIPIDMMQNLHVELASVSVIDIDDHGARIRFLNHTGPSVV